MTKYIDELTRSPIFAGLSFKDICTFLYENDYSVKECNMFENIEVKKDKVIFLISGSIRRVYVDEGGNITYINTYHYDSENIITDGMYGTFFQMSYVSLEPSIILYIPINSLVKNKPSISKIQNIIYKNIIYSLIFSNQKDTIVTTFNVQKGVKNKLKKYCEYQLNTPRGFTPFSLTKQEVAGMLKVDYSSLCREIKTLSEEIPNIEDCFSTLKHN